MKWFCYEASVFVQVVSTVGKKNNCTYCGVFRRQALDRGAAQLKVDKLATGHNADDVAETVSTLPVGEIL